MHLFTSNVTILKLPGLIICVERKDNSFLLSILRLKNGHLRWWWLPFFSFSDIMFSLRFGTHSYPSLFHFTNCTAESLIISLKEDLYFNSSFSYCCSCGIQLFRERLSEKEHATIPKGILGSFEFTFLQRNLKEWHQRPWMYVCESYRKAKIAISTATVSGTVYWSYPILPFGIVAYTFFPTTFLEIAVYYFLWYSDPSEQMDQSSILIYIWHFEVPRDQGKERIGCPLYVF